MFRAASILLVSVLIYYIYALKKSGCNNISKMHDCNLVQIKAVTKWAFQHLRSLSKLTGLEKLICAFISCSADTAILLFF